MKKLKQWDIIAAKCSIFFSSNDWEGMQRYWICEYWARKHWEKHSAFKSSQHYNLVTSTTLQPRNQHRKIENAHLNKSTYCLDKFLQEKNGFLRKGLDKKQNIFDNLINLLNGVTTKRDETNSSCTSLQIKSLLKKLAALMKRSVLIIAREKISFLKRRV